MNQMFNFGNAGLYAVMAVWGIAAVVAALAGIQYVAKFSTYLPLIPAGILIALIAKTVGGVGSGPASPRGGLRRRLRPARSRPRA